MGYGFHFFFHLHLNHLQLVNHESTATQPKPVLDNQQHVNGSERVAPSSSICLPACGAF